MTEKQFNNYLTNLLDKASKAGIAMVVGYTTQDGKVVQCAANLEQPVDLAQQTFNICKKAAAAQSH